METEYSLEVKNVYKKYNKTDDVLHNLTMSVPKGKMYGLLGPSGCGKTTLLRCVLGRLSIDSGVIKLSVKRRCEIGFMPQGISLQPELTVRETFVFYGALYGLVGKNLKIRMEQLCDLLDLTKNKLIENCSGGQQRRVSLAMSLLHDPDFLLLDEPTVGLDAILSHRIWTYIKDLCYTHNKTILVTTHYMEEARGLDMVGLMRGGEILSEKPPLDLIAQFNCSSLDDVFVEVIKKKPGSTANQGKELDKRITLKNNVEKFVTKLENKKVFDWQHVWAQIYKNYIWSLRSIYVMIFVITLPLFGAVIVGWEYRDLYVTKEVFYYNEEVHSCLDADLIQIDNCTPSIPYTCAFLNLLSQHYYLKRSDSVQEGIEEVRRGNSYVFLHLPPNFTSSVQNRMSFRLNDVSLYIHEEKPILVWQDNTEYQISNIFKWHAYASMQKLLEIKTVECGIDVRLAKSTLSYRPEYVYGANNTFSSSIYPVVATGLAHYMSFLYTSALLLMEISSGVLERVKINGLTTPELLVANSLVHLVYDVMQNILALFTIHVVMGEPNHGSVALLFFMLVLNQLQASSMTIFITTFPMTAAQVNYIAMAIVVFILTTGGFVWPTEGIHWMLEPFALYNPITMLGKSYGQVMLHGFGLTNHRVYPSLINSVVWIFLWIGLTTTRVKFFTSSI